MLQRSALDAVAAQLVEAGALQMSALTLQSSAQQVGGGNHLAQDGAASP